MVGTNCSIIGCSSSGRKSGVAIFKVPEGDNEWSCTWRKSILSIVTKDRVIDKALRERIMKKKYFFCEKHSEDQLIRCMYKMISFLFLQKSLKVSCNSGRQAYYIEKKAVSTLVFFIGTTL